MLSQVTHSGMHPHLTGFSSCLGVVPVSGTRSSGQEPAQLVNHASDLRGSILLLLPPIPPSSRVFSNESTLRKRWPKYWNVSFSIIPSKEIPGLISFRMDWLDLLAVQGTLKSLLQHIYALVCDICFLFLIYFTLYNRLYIYLPH